MKSEQELEQRLQALHKHKKGQIKLSDSQIDVFKQQNRKPFRQNIWRSVQWTLACSGVLLASTLVFKQHNQKLTYVHNIELSDYQHVESHSLDKGQYAREIVSVKTQLDQTFNEQLYALKAHSAFYGKIVKTNDKTWFIEDCNKNILLEVEKELLAKFKPKGLEINEGTMLALKSNNRGQIIKFLPLDDQQNSKHCLKA